MPPKATRLDEIGDWSELKLEILAKYASAYTRILHSNRLHPIYIDGFAGAGEHISRRSGELVPGSPLNALAIKPAFEKIHLVDLKQERIENLVRLAEGDRRVKVYTGNANAVLLDKVFPTIKYHAFERALCVLDPYGMNLDWAVLQTAGLSETIEIFLNFPIMDMNRNVFRRSGEADPKDLARMNRFWGDESWREVAYRTDTNLFEEPEKQSNAAIVAGFRERLKKVAGFRYVPEPAPMRNSINAVVYYLFFAASSSHSSKHCHWYSQSVSHGRKIAWQIDRVSSGRTRRGTPFEVAQRSAQVARTAMRRPSQNVSVACGAIRMSKGLICGLYPRN